MQQNSPIPATADDLLAAEVSAERFPRCRNRVTVAVVCSVLAALVWFAFGQATHHDFVNYDDGEYVYANPKITAGLTWSGVQWALTHVHAYNWHPVTTISHMLDCQIYALHPWGHHLTNLLLHALAAILLFLALRALTRGVPVAAALSRGVDSDKTRGQSAAATNLWACWFVAALFATHPLHVESVAWIAERKDVLSGVFFSLTLLAYARYVRNLGTNPHSLRRYLAVVIFFALGLLSKPTLVTLPFVLLLLDYWPLQRMQSSKDNRTTRQGDHKESRVPVVTHLVVEKIPLFGLSAASCVATVIAQQGALKIARTFTFPERIANAAVSYVVYLWQFIFPARLIVYYPYPHAVWQITPAVGAFLLVVAISAAALYWRRTHPFLVVGWFWYVGMLIPMIGIVQVGSQAHADRYTYVTQIGLYIVLVWGGLKWLGQRRYGKQVLAAVGILTVAALTARSAQQTSYWQNGETLWLHTLDVTPNNQLAHNNLGAVYVQKKQFAKGILHFQKAIDIQQHLPGAPEYVDAQNNLGNALMQNLPNVEASQQPAQVDEAIAHLNKALEAKPDFSEALTNLATALVDKGQLDEAISDYHKALEIDPNLPEANGNLGNVLLQEGKVDEAITNYHKAIDLQPNYSDAHYGLGRALIQKGAINDAIDHLYKAVDLDQSNVDAQFQLGSSLLQIGKTTDGIEKLRNLLVTNPDHPEAHQNLAVGLTRTGQLDRAVQEYQKAIELRPGYAQAENNLGNVLLRLGRTSEAIKHLQQAVSIEPDYAEAYNDLGSAFMQEDHIPEAIARYEKAITLRPDYAEAHSNLGNAYLQHGEIDKAIEEDRKAVALRPDSAPMQLNLGNALVAKGNRAEGISCYQTALRIQPNYAAVKEQLRKLAVSPSD